MNFIFLRADSHAQYEIRVYADIIYKIMESWVPITAEAFKSYRSGSVELSAEAMDVIKLMLSGNKGAEQQAAAKKVMPFFPNQDGRGTHMNISGGGILKHAPNKANAVKLLEFLLTPEAQQHIVNNTFEYPMIPGVKANKLIAQFGLDFKQDLKTKVSNYGKLQAKALKVMNEAGW